MTLTNHKVKVVGCRKSFYLPRRSNLASKLSSTVQLRYNMSPGISPKSFESDRQLMVARSRSESLQGRGGCKLVFTGETSLYKYVEEMSKGYVLIWNFEKITSEVERAL